MQTPTAAEPLVGTWKVNFEKSDYGALPVPQRNIACFEARENGVFKFTAEAVDASGQAIQSEFFTKLEGEECPVTGSRLMDTVIARRIDAWTTEWIAKKDGKVVATATEVVSADGKTLTGTWATTGDNGQILTWITVSDKQ